jgi:hypothetical protein
MKRVLFAVALFCILAVSPFAQEPHTKNTLKLTAGQKGGAAKIADMAWLAGTWRGTGLGGESEEVWSEPREGVMMGMYRMLKDGKPIFYEFLTLSESDGTLMMRLKHFHANFVGWEEKDKTVDFPFIKKDGKRMFFDGMTFELVGKDDVNVYLVIGGKDGSVREEIFKYKRVK